jgi:hypothetical protein
MKISFITAVSLATFASAQTTLQFGPRYYFKVSTGNEILRTETIYTPGSRREILKASSSSGLVYGFQKTEPRAI